MLRVLIACALCLSLAPASLAAAPAPAGPRIATLLVATKLKTVIKFDGFDDPKLALQDALEYLADRYDISFDVNEAAFEAEDIATVLATEIAKTPIPKMHNVTVIQVLRKVLSRIKAPSGATYVIRDDHIEITTLAALRKEVFGEKDRRMLPLVYVAFDQCPLNEALDELASQSGMSVVLDGEAGALGKKTITAGLTNVPLDTAIDMLADMANLRATMRDNAVYVTTQDKSQAIRQEWAKPVLPKVEKLGVAPQTEN
jgi:hypothetical protein